MDNKINDLQQLRIHELRDLARKMGVNAPTSKKKEEIIDEIMKIMNGEVVPFSHNTKKGRPVRSSSDNFDVVDFMLPNPQELQVFDDYSTYDDGNDRLRFMINMNHAEYGTSRVNETHEYEGIVEIKHEGFGVLHVMGYTSNMKDVFINPTQVKQLGLKSGEKLKVTSRKVKENYPDIAIKIERYEECSKYNFDDQEILPLESKIVPNFPNFKEFCIGGRYYIKPQSDSYVETANIARKLQQINPEMVVETLYLNAMPERLPYTKEIKVNSIAFNKSDEDIINATKLYFERMKRIAETGKDVVCIINEFSQYTKSYNNIYVKSGNAGEISNRIGYLTKLLLSTAKRTNNGSVTILVVDSLRVPTAIYDVFQYDILPIFHNV